MILNPSASHFAFGKLDVRERFVLEGSRAFGVSYVYANLLGNEAGRAIYDGGALIASGGRAASPPGRGSPSPTGSVTTAVIDVDATRMTQARTGSFQPAPGRAGDDCSRRARSPIPTLAPRVADRRSRRLGDAARTSRKRSSPAPSRWRCSTTCARAARTASSSRSAAAPTRRPSRCLVALMVEFGVRGAGPRRLRSRSSATFRRLERRRRPRAIVRRLLTCVYQATRNSGDVTRNAAARRGRGARRRVPRVRRRRRCVQGYIGMVEQGASAARSTWQTDDIALQNIQARVRSPGVWMLANLRGALLLSTSNRSRGGRRLRHDGRRHLRRPQPDRRHRQGLPAALAALAGERRARRARPDPRAARPSTRSRRPPSCARRARTRPTKPT